MRPSLSGASLWGHASSAACQLPVTASFQTTMSRPRTLTACGLAVSVVTEQRTGYHCWAQLKLLPLLLDWEEEERVEEEEVALFAVVVVVVVRGETDDDVDVGDANRGDDDNEGSFASFVVRGPAQPLFALRDGARPRQCLCEERFIVCWKEIFPSTRRDDLV